MQTLAAFVKADYVVWGQVTEDQGLLRVQSAIYDGVGGQQIVQDVVQLDRRSSVGDTTNATCAGTDQSRRATTDRSPAFDGTRIAACPAPGVADNVLTPVSNVKEAQGPLTCWL